MPRILTGWDETKGVSQETNITPESHLEDVGGDRESQLLYSSPTPSVANHQKLTTGKHYPLSYVNDHVLVTPDCTVLSTEHARMTADTSLTSSLVTGRVKKGRVGQGGQGYWTGGQVGGGERSTVSALAVGLQI